MSPQGVPDSYTSSWDFLDLATEPLDFVIAHAAAQRVLFALETVRAYFSLKAFDIAKANLPKDRYDEFYHLYTAAEAMDGVLNHGTSQLAVRVAASLPTKLDTLENMLQAALVGCGLCCEAAVDHFIAELVPQHEIDDLKAKFPEFDAAWLTMRGAVELKKARSMKLSE